MYNECTFSPAIKNLPASYNVKGGGKGGADFNTRSEAWQESRRNNLEAMALEHELKEVEGCTWEPALPGAQSNANMRESIHASEERENDVVKRLHDVETRRLKERREMEVSTTR